MRFRIRTGEFTMDESDSESKIVVLDNKKGGIFMKKLEEMTMEELWQLFPVVLKEYNPDYILWYEEERKNIEKRIGKENIFRIRHIGSTSVPGLLSKPTVDILLELVPEAEQEKIVSSLKEEWILMSESEKPKKFVFNKGYTPAGFAEKVTDKSQVSPEDMTLEEYKAYFNEKMNSLYTHPSQRNRNDIIDITDAAYKRMQTDPEYEKKILDALAKNKAVNFGNYIPQISYMHIDDTYEKCYGYTQGMKENDGYSGSSSAKGTDAGRQKKARQKELLEEYLEKRAQMKEFQQEALEEKIAKQELERSRLTKAWSSKRQMAMASNAYDANVMTETATGSEV